MFLRAALNLSARILGETCAFLFEMRNNGNLRYYARTPNCDLANVPQPSLARIATLSFWPTELLAAFLGATAVSGSNWTATAQKENAL